MNALPSPWRLRVSLVAAAAALLAPSATAAERKNGEDPATRWAPATVELFGTLPVQYGGRVKPLDSFARFQLLKLRGTRTMRVAGEKIPAVEWLLNVFFRPEEAKRYRAFIVDNSEVLTAIGVDLGAVEETRGDEAKPLKRRDRFSYNEIIPARDRLQELWAEAAAIENDRDKTTFQTQVETLGRQVAEFEVLVKLFDFARERYQLPGVGEVGVTDLLRDDAVRGGLAADFSAVAAGGRGASPFSDRFYPLARDAAGMFLCPPPEAERREWASPGQILIGVTSREDGWPWGLERIELMEGLAAAAGDGPLFAKLAGEFHAMTTAEAEARGELGKVEREVTLNAVQPFYKALRYFILGFLAVAVSWLAPEGRSGRWGRALCWGLTGLGLGYVVWGIVQRSLIRGLDEGMGPITNLYETIVFIGGFMVLLCFLTERFTKKRLALAVAPVVGAAGMLLSILYEGAGNSDTLGRLPAVLITNFWLAVHVPIVNIGYAGCMLAALMSWVYFGFRAFDLGRRDSEFFRSLTRMVYGVLCFGMVFALVGTVLGGIWANDSWGRFWGWDPKENGALMIVLWSLAMLHARMGGYVNEAGFHLWSIILGVIVAFSWFHVNVLGVGLHSYGFSQAVKLGVTVFYAISATVFAFGVAVTALAARKQWAAKEERDRNRRGGGSSGEPARAAT